MFFYRWDLNELANSHLVLPTLASQLSQFDSRYKQALYEAKENDNLASKSASLQAQFDSLIHKPLSASSSERPIIIVVVNTDGSALMPNFQEMLRILLQFESVRLGGPKLYIFIATSMKERRQFIQENNDHLANIVPYNIDECISRGGIRAYFEDRFAKFSDGSGEFPGPEQFEKLLDDCGSIYDYAWTAARFISDGDPVGHSMQILDMNQSYRTSESTGHYVKLDNLYLGILQRAVPKTKGLVRRVLATIVCFERLAERL